MGGGNDGGSSDEEEEDDGEHGVDSADERLKVGGQLGIARLQITAPGYFLPLHDSLRWSWISPS